MLLCGGQSIFIWRPHLKKINWVFSATTGCYNVLIRLHKLYYYYLLLYCLCSYSCKFSGIIATLNCFLFLLGSMLLQHQGGWVTSQLFRGNCSYMNIAEFFFFPGYAISSNLALILTLGDLQISQNNGHGVGRKPGHQACTSWRVSC